MTFGAAKGESCPICFSMGRHRLARHLLGDLLSASAASLPILHFAPEPGLRLWLSANDSISYVTADPHAADVDHEVDIQRLPFLDHSFSGIICSHVLEHVPDDRRALAEMFRVLTPGGFALLAIPYYGGMDTDEDAQESDPVVRAHRFGQHDHFRFYGRDVVERITEAGFSVEVVEAIDAVGASGCSLESIRRDETAFVCTRPA